jgi:hypothetical protein
MAVVYAVTKINTTGEVPRSMPITLRYGIAGPRAHGPAVPADGYFMNRLV